MNDNLETNPDGGGGDNTGSEQAWLSSVPENLRTNEAFKGVETSSDAWQQFVDMKVSSKTALQIPGENATDEDRSAFMNALGRPETADKYTFTKPEGLPEGLQYDDTVTEAFKSMFHEVGLSDANAGKLWEKYHEIAAQGHESEQKFEKEAMDTAVNQLKDEWSGDKFKVNTELAKRVFTNIFEDEAKQTEAKAFIQDTKINGLSLGDHPMFLKIFQQIGSVISDDVLNSGGGEGGEGGMSEEDKAKKRFPNTKFKQ